MLTPARPYLWQFVSYAFLHGGIMHIFFNMYFLFLFGNNVNDKLGSVGYLGFYLAGAVFSGIGHTLFNNAPVLGASGAVAAVVGAYMVLFPQTLITVIYWFFIFGTMELPALYFILLKLIIIDNIVVRYTPDVAYDAHLVGYAIGILATLFLLATGLVSTSNFDLWAMLKQRNRRRRYQDVVAAGYDPFSSRGVRKIKVKQVKAKPVDAGRKEKITELRENIALRLTQRNTSEAARLYLELMATDSQQLLPKQYLLDIANQLASDKRPDEAAKAYEQFLSHYANYEYIEQIQLMLGILYSRYLNQPASAVKHLKAAAEKLTNPDQLKMCKDELAKLEN
jgi:membrane associated rhomboid family serine protease